MNIYKTPLPISALTVDKPTDFDLFDIDGKLLLARGNCVTRTIYELLLERRVYRLCQAEEQPVEAKRFSSKIYREVLGSIQHLYYEAALLNSEQVSETMDLVEVLIGELNSSARTFIDLNELRSYDNNLYVHSVNVAILAGMIGIELEYKPQELKELVLGSLLHDLGKLAIPLELLNKPGVLTVDEFNLMKQHPEMGIRMLDNVRLPSRILNIIRHHHERWDGSGYPSGLREQQNTLDSQITAVADVFDAITADRPYRRSLPFYQSCEIIMTNPGLSPQVLAAFRNCIVFYPENSVVTLSSGEKGQVIAVPRNYPTRPTVRILSDADGNPVSGLETVDLLKELTLFIKDVDFSQAIA